MSGGGICSRCCRCQCLGIFIPCLTVAVICDRVLHGLLGRSQVFDKLQNALLKLCVKLFDQLNGSDYVSNTAGRALRAVP